MLGSLASMEEPSFSCAVQLRCLGSRNHDCNGNRALIEHKDRPYSCFAIAGEHRCSALSMFAPEVTARSRAARGKHLGGSGSERTHYGAATVAVLGPIKEIGLTNNNWLSFATVGRGGLGCIRFIAAPGGDCLAHEILQNVFGGGTRLTGPTQEPFR